MDINPGLIDINILPEEMVSNKSQGNSESMTL